VLLFNVCSSALSFEGDIAVPSAKWRFLVIIVHAGARIRKSARRSVGGPQADYQGLSEIRVTIVYTAALLLERAGRGRGETRADDYVSFIYEPSIAEAVG
jgi:hypothetical protein